MKDEKIKFSIIIPCYNLETIVENTINSVIEQTYANFELLLIDDGSIDNTLKRLQLFSSKDNRIKVFSKENGGVSSARNYGIDIATGEYILFLDGDDRITPSLLESAYNVLEDKNIDMYSFGYVKVNDKGKKIKSYSHNKYNMTLHDGRVFLEKFLYKKISQSICSCIIKREIIANNHILFDLNTKIAEDIEFQIKCMSKCNLVFYNSREYFIYINREGSAVKQKPVGANLEVYARIENYLEDINIVAGGQFLCFGFVYLYKNIVEKGSDPATIKRYLEFEYLLKKYKFGLDKYSLITFLFIIFYKPVFKRYLVSKYNLGKRV